MFDVGTNPTDARGKGKPARSADGTDIPERAMRGLTDVFKGYADSLAHELQPQSRT